MSPNGCYLSLQSIQYGLVSILSGEIPDVEDDLLAHKATWLSRLGRRRGFMLTGGLLLAASIYFFLSPLIFHRLAVDPRVIGVFSFLPMAVGAWGMLRQPLERNAATRIAIAMMASMVAFALIVNAYLVYLIFHSAT
jgi:1,4-dihydroxy-2-naphthoate octaprenyltransferase